MLPAAEDLRHLRQALQLAKEIGKGLRRSPPLVRMCKPVCSDLTARLDAGAACPGHCWNWLTSSLPTVLRGGRPMPGMSA